MKYSIIVPVYKEKHNILILINKIFFVLNKNSVVFELIIVNDDSNDGSKKEFLKSNKKKVKFIIRKDKPRDLSKSVLYGVKFSKYNNIIVMDGDLQHNPSELIKLIDCFENKKTDLVIASRKFYKLKKSLSLIDIFIKNFIKLVVI